MEAMLVGIGGGLGACCRYAIAYALQDGWFPWSTLVVNVVGSFMLGVVLVGLSMPELVLLVGVGFCGAFTTFASFSFQTVSLWEQERRFVAFLNAAANLLTALGGFAVALILFA